MVNLLEKNSKNKRKSKGKETDFNKIKEFEKKIAELIERTRLIEERVKNIMEKVHVVNKTALSNVKEIQEVNTGQNKRISELKNEIENLKNTIRKIGKGLSSKANESEVKILKKYVEMMDATRFISEKDVKEIVDEKLKDLKK